MCVCVCVCVCGEFRTEATDSGLLSFLLPWHVPFSILVFCRCNVIAGLHDLFPYHVF
jgi:hypothetical protein